MSPTAVVNGTVFTLTTDLGFIHLLAKDLLLLPELEALLEAGQEE